MVQIIEKRQYIIKESGIPCAGSGLFAKKDISPGTILPYNTFVKKYSDLSEDEDPTYFMAIAYKENGKDKTLRNFVTDGNPKLFKGSKKNLSAAAYVNEASLYPPNCVFVTNPLITKENVIETYKNKHILTSSFLVVPFEIKKGEELFTMYGPSYETREYKQWRDKNGYKNRLIEESHLHVNSNVEEIKNLFES